MFTVTKETTKFVVYADEVTPITTEQAQYLQRNEVVLVRSKNVPFPDHFIVIHGGMVQKPWGFRPKTTTVIAEAELVKQLLDRFPAYNGVTALKLKDDAKMAFLAIHGTDLPLECIEPWTM